MPIKPLKKGKHILITGATGFVGNHLVEKALEEGYTVHALVRNPAKVFQRKNINYLFADITSYKEVYEALSLLKNGGMMPDYIIHAAALTKSNSRSRIETVNYLGTDILYQCLKKLNYRPEKIIFLSSLAAGGPEKSDHHISLSNENPVTTYGKSKLKAEKMVLNSSLNTVIIRPTAVYGPGDKDLYSVFKLINTNFNPLLGSHRQQLTFIYVTDLVNLIFSALESGQAGKIYFATDGFVYDKTDFPKIVAKKLNKKPVTFTIPLAAVKLLAILSQGLSLAAGKTSSLNLEKYKELVAESWMCDAETTFSDLNYRPAFNLERGIGETTKWYKEHKWL